MTRRTTFRTMGIVAVVPLLTVALFGGGAAAGSESSGSRSDSFSTPSLIPDLPFSATADTTGYGVEDDEPSPPCLAGGGFDKTAWYMLIPSSDVQVVADTFGSSYDTALAAYVGARGPLACNDDDPAGAPQSRVTFVARAGEPYLLQVAAKGAGSAGGTLRLTVVAGGIAASDAFPPPLPILLLPFTDFDVPTTAATTQAGEPVPSCAAAAGRSHTVWYALRVDQATDVVAQTFGSSYDTVVAVFHGDWDDEVACNDDARGTPQSEAVFTAEAGATYHVQISAKGSASAGGLLDLRLAVPWDDYLAPRDVPGIPYHDSVSTRDATVQIGEPSPSCIPPAQAPLWLPNFGHSVWYLYLPAVDTILTAGTAGSDYDTVLAVYERSWDTPVACSDDVSFGDHTSLLTFTARAGVPYYFQVAGYGSGSSGGNLEFHMDGVTLPQTCRGETATIVGSVLPDTIFGTQGRDVIVGAAGNDLILSRGGNDLICAGPGYDRVFAGTGADRVFGQAGNDILQGGGGADVIHGWGGEDLIIGKGGDDRLFGGANADTLLGNEGYDVLRGGPGIDACYSGEDVIC